MAIISTYFTIDILIWPIYTFRIHELARSAAICSLMQTCKGELAPVDNCLEKIKAMEKSKLQPGSIETSNNWASNDTVQSYKLITGVNIMNKPLVEKVLQRKSRIS